MNKQEIQEIIDRFESTNSKGDAYFAIFQVRGADPDESFIKANKGGLELYTATLLKAIRDTDETSPEKEMKIIPLDYNENWIHGDIYIQYVELTFEKNENVKFGPIKPTWKNRLAGLGCFVFLGILILSIIIGVLTIAGWVFDLRII